MGKLKGSRVLQALILKIFFTGLPKDPFFFGVITTLQVPLVLSLIAQVVLVALMLQEPVMVCLPLLALML